MKNDLLYVSNSVKIQKENDLEIVKSVLDGDRFSEKVISFQNELSLTSVLEVPGVRKAKEYFVENGIPKLKLDFVYGITLKNFLQKHTITLDLFFKIGIQLAEILSNIHDQKIIHKDFNSNNILINEETLKVTIIDFEISTRYTLKDEYKSNLHALEGTLAYISPEQTGRMNRVVDSRSDLYSLGIVFYELLSGRLPFDSLDPIELVHAHIAKTPISLLKLNSKVPEVLSSLVDKLVMKNAEMRYHTANGVKWDLLEISNTVSTGTDLSTIQLGERDYSGKLYIPEKLYGREVELSNVLSIFENTVEGSKELVLVAGYSGTGKSSLIKELHKPITENNGIFVSGKFDQLQKNTPYSALIQVLNSLSNFQVYPHIYLALL